MTRTDTMRGKVAASVDQRREELGTSAQAPRDAGARPAMPSQSAPSPLVLVLPEPPAANRYLRTHGHVTYKTREAKAYCELVATLAHAHCVNGGPAFPVGDVSVAVVWHRGRKAGDLGERTKCLYDSLQGSVYTDDKQIAHDSRWRVDAHDEVPKGQVRITVSNDVPVAP